MSDRLVLTAAARGSIVDHAQHGASQTPPVEICGILAGTRENDTNRITEIRQVPNVAAAPQTRYELDPESTLETIDALEANGFDVVGFYHSHPNGPSRPSATDRAQATWTDYVYLIVSLADDPELGAWRWTGDSFEKLTIEITESGN